MHDNIKNPFTQRGSLVITIAKIITKPLQPRVLVRWLIFENLLHNGRKDRGKSIVALGLLDCVVICFRFLNQPLIFHHTLHRPALHLLLQDLDCNLLLLLSGSLVNVCAPNPGHRSERLQEAGKKLCPEIINAFLPCPK